MIRAAQPGDLAGMLAIWNPIIRDTPVTFTSQEKTGAGLWQMIDTRRRAGHETFVAEADGMVQGLATYDQFRGGDGYFHAMEHTVHVSPQARARGLGRALMLAVEDHARRAGHHTMHAGVSGENPQAIAFHAALGYATIATIPQVGWKFGRWMDLVVMQKRLSDV